MKIYLGMAGLELGSGVTRFPGLVCNLHEKEGQGESNRTSLTRDEGVKPMKK